MTEFRLQVVKIRIYHTYNLLSQHCIITQHPKVTRVVKFLNILEKKFLKKIAKLCCFWSMAAFATGNGNKATPFPGSTWVHRERSLKNLSIAPTI